MNTIQLDDNWTITADTYSWKLSFSYMLMKDEYKQIDGRPQKTGEQTLQDVKEEWYFPSIKMCLDRYLQEVFKSDKSISEIANRLSGIESKVNEVKGIFKK